MYIDLTSDTETIKFASDEAITIYTAIRKDDIVNVSQQFSDFSAISDPMKEDMINSNDAREQVCKIGIELTNGDNLLFDIQDVLNQPTWTADQAGLNQAVADINSSLNTISLTIADAEAQDKVYDGTTDAVITGTLTGMEPGDTVTLNGTGVFDTADVGVAKPVTSTSTLSGAQAPKYSVAKPAGLTATITKANQLITFGALADKTVLDVDYDPGATSPTSGVNEITYASSNPAVATIVDGLIHIVGAGNTSITASQAASANYNAAPDVIQALTVNP